MIVDGSNSPDPGTCPSQKHCPPHKHLFALVQRKGNLDTCARCGARDSLSGTLTRYLRAIESLEAFELRVRSYGMGEAKVGLVRRERKRFERELGVLVASRCATFLG